ncbi:MAG TPA: cbb3-type cytochrome c oxidase subunit I [Verrucomicrobiota bacterium]|nr:cbb3-type cytochrome c oxidase subunit I [Verrucomicrobiota bacterium]HNT14919.1 cbb3-type cytochrome c oxidase subunit I [Verrucomicrobiota bacterium]
MTATTLPSPGPIDRSCRSPLFALFGGAAGWLALSSAFGLAAAMTFHNPALLAGCSVLTFGRAYPAWAHLFIYGFGVPTALGAGLWLLARLGRIKAMNPALITVGAKLWHVGVLVGLLGIVTGDSSGFEWLELPRYAAVILFLAFMLMTVWLFMTFSWRAEPRLYPSQWFVLAAVFWFIWIFSTAVFLLQMHPVRGVVQAAVAWWFAGNLLNVWLPLAGLAVTFYVLPKLSGKPLHSYYLALFIFVTVALFGSWTGMPVQAPLPAWMGIFSSTAAALMVVPALALGILVVKTSGGGDQPPCFGGVLCFAKFGAFMLILATLLAAVAACPVMARVTEFTWFTEGQVLLRLYGFFAMTLFAAVYHILPRISGREISPRRVRAHFWLAMPGSLLLALPLLAGGVRQGLRLADAAVPFQETARAAVLWVRISTLGETLIALGALVYLANVGWLILSHYRALLKREMTDALAWQPVEVKS